MTSFFTACQEAFSTGYEANKASSMVQSINIKALTTLASVVRRPYLAAPHVFVPTVSGKCISFAHNILCTFFQPIPTSSSNLSALQYNTNQIHRNQLPSTKRPLRNKSRNIRQRQHPNRPLRKYSPPPRPSRTPIGTRHIRSKECGNSIKFSGDR